MNILIISSSDPTTRAGTGALAIRDGLKYYGYNVKIITKYYLKNDSDNDIITYYSPFLSYVRGIFRKIRDRIINLIVKNRELKALLQDTIPFLPSKNPFKFSKLAGFVPDAIIIFFATAFVNYVDLLLINKIYKCPIFISTPDMYPFTGICHYSGPCKKYEYFCGACPLLKSKFKYDISWVTMKIKHSIIKRTNLIGLCWTNEYENFLRNSSLFKNLPIVKLPVFMYLKKEMLKPDKQIYDNLRNKFGINNNDYVIMISSVSLNDERKGINDIIDAINIVVKNIDIYNKLIVITAGYGDLPKKPNVKQILNFGFVNYDKLAEIFKVSDVFISASYEDVGPGTIPYALICGVPVISYDTGIAIELISDYENGFIVKKKNITELSEKIKEHFYMSQEKKEYMSNCAYNSVKYIFDYSFAKDLDSALRKYIIKYK